MTDDSLTRKTFVGASWLVLWRVVTRVLGFASTLVLARLLVPADFGLVAMATTFAVAIDALSHLGIADALVRDPRDDRRLFDTAFTLGALRAAATTAVIALGAPVAAWWFDEPRLEALLLVLAAANLVSGFENIGIVEFRRAMRFDVQFRMLAVPRLLQLLTTIPIAIATGSYWALILGTVVGKVARTVMTYALHPYRPGFALAGWRELAGFSFWTWATALANLVWERCDAFVLGPRFGPTQLGKYILAFEVATLPVTELIAPAADALFAGFASAQRRGADSLGLAMTVAGALFLAIVPVIAAISCAAGYVVAALLGPNWVEARPLIAILAWQCLFSPFSYVCSVVLVANGQVRRNFVANLVSAAAKLAGLVAVVSLTDRLEHVAAATVGIVALESLAFVTQLRAVGDVRLRPVAGGILRGALGGAAVLLALHGLGLAWQPVSLPAVPALLACALTGAVALAVFWATVLSLWALTGFRPGPESLLLGFAKDHFVPIVAGRMTRRHAG